MKICMTVAYDGTNYGGWQRQKNSVSIQEEIEKALSLVYKRAVAVLGASRTDAGVHALGQCAVFSLSNEDFAIPVQKLPLVVNRFLPEDIRVLRAEEAAEYFHPIGDTIKKTYSYQIWNALIESPLTRLYAEHIYLPLDFPSMQKAAPFFIGEHDFKAFCAAGGYAKTSVRTVYGLTLSQNGRMITMTITGNGFLYNMVRIIAGTLIDIGLGRIDGDDLPGIINSLDRTKAGKTASAKGLTLQKIYYSPAAERREN